MTSSSKVAQRYLSSAKRDDPKKKNTGKGGLDTWFSGHGGGKPKERATWGDWIAITPVKHTVKKENGKDKTYEAGDIVGPCAVSSQPEWSSVTDGGKRPLKCMPREKAHKMPKKERASLARTKKREEKKHRGQKPVMTPTFSKKSDFYREISPPDSLSSMQSGTPVSKDNTGKNEGEGSALPNGDTARNIGRPSPDSPNLKYRNLDKGESVGRTPANKEDLGYVHDSGSGSARVIPWDSGYANNSSPLRKAGLIKPPKKLVDMVTTIAQGALAQYALGGPQDESSVSKDELDSFRWSYEDIVSLPRDIKRGDADLEEVTYQLDIFKSKLKSLEDKSVLAGEIFRELDEISPKEVMENPSSFKASFLSIRSKAERMAEGLSLRVSQKVTGRVVKRRFQEAKDKISSLKSSSYYEWVLYPKGFLSRIKIRAHFDYNPPIPASYIFQWGNHNIDFFFDIRRESFSISDLNKLRDYARHELVHAMQTEYTERAKLRGLPRDSEAGLPFKRRDTRFNQHMREEEEKLKADYRRRGLDPRDISVHALDDIEFYSRLLDEVELFKRTYRDPSNEDIKGYIRKNGFFKAMKALQKAKWTKAVKIFVSEVKPSEPMSRRAAEIGAILNKMSDAVIDRSSSVRIVADNYLERLKEEPITVSVGDHEVTLEVKEGGDIYLSCTCPFWRYQGPEYHASKEGYLYGSLRGTGDEPKKKDPNGINKLCKHSYALLNSIFGD